MATSELQSMDPNTVIERDAILWKFESLKALQEQAEHYRHPSQWPAPAREIRGPRSTRDKASNVAKKLHELCTKEMPYGGWTRRLLYMTHRESVLFMGEAVSKKEIDTIVDVAIVPEKKACTIKIWPAHRDHRLDRWRGHKDSK